MIMPRVCKPAFPLERSPINFEPKNSIAVRYLWRSATPWTQRVQGGTYAVTQAERTHVARGRRLKST